MIKWTGTDTSKRMTWEAEAETYKELAEKLADRDGRRLEIFYI